MLEGVLASDDPNKLAQCIASLKDFVCRRFRCTGKAYWFVAASGDCVLTVGGEASAVTERAYVRRYEAPVKIVCTDARHLVDSAEMVLHGVEGCESVMATLKA